jgi:hypothetical protein
MVKLGSKCRDSITGLTGIATARTEYLYGCVHVCINPQELKDGKPVDCSWFDEQRVEVIEEKPPVVSPASSAASGGPNQSPPARSHG